MAAPKLAGPVGNSARDLRDDFVGEPAEDLKAGEAKRWPPKPKRITKDTFHAKVQGETAPKRADRASHFRKGGWVSGYQAGGFLTGVGEKPAERWKRENREAQEAGFAERKKRADEEAARQREQTVQRKSGGSVASKLETGQDSPARDREFKKGGHLSMAQRKALPSKSFALPGKGAGPSGKGAGSYPIPDASHARNALARVSQHGSSEEKAKVRAKVHAKFPGIGQK